MEISYESWEWFGTNQSLHLLITSITQASINLYIDSYIHSLPILLEHVGQHPTKLFSELLPVHGGAGGQTNLLHSERVFCEIKMDNNI